MRDLLMSSRVADSSFYIAPLSFISLLVSVWPPTVKLVGPQLSILNVSSTSSFDDLVSCLGPQTQLKHKRQLGHIAIRQRSSTHLARLLWICGFTPGAGHYPLLRQKPSVHVGLVVADQQCVPTECGPPVK